MGKSRDKQHLTEEDLMAAGRSGFDGSHPDWGKIQAQHRQDYASSVRTFEDLGLTNQVARQMHDRDMARNARPYADLFMTPRESTEALATVCKDMVDGAIANAQRNAEKAAQEGRPQAETLDVRDVTIKGAEVLAVDANNFNEHQGDAYLNTVVAVPVSLESLPSAAADKVRAASEDIGVPVTDKTRILFPLNVAIKNPRAQYQEPVFDSDGNPRGHAVLGQAQRGISDADARAFVSAPDPSYPGSGLPRFTDYKFMVRQAGEDATAQQRFAQAPTIKEVLDNTERYSDTDRSKAMRAAKGLAICHATGIQRGALLNFRCSQLEAALQRSIGGLTPTERRKHASGENVEPKPAKGRISVMGDGSLSDKRWATAADVGTLMGGSISHLQRNKKDITVEMPPKIKAILDNTARAANELRARRSSGAGIGD